MRRWIVYLVCICGVLALQGEMFGGTDVSELSPVELIRVFREEARICVQTDTGDTGEGADLDEALENLTDTAPGIVLLETVDYLLISPECVDLLDPLSRLLRPACAVCLSPDAPELEEAAEYLSIHEPDVTLHCWRTGEPELPILSLQKGRLLLVQ